MPLLSITHKFACTAAVAPLGLCKEGNIPVLFSISALYSALLAVHKNGKNLSFGGFAAGCCSDPC